MEKGEERRGQGAGRACFLPYHFSHSAFSVPASHMPSQGHGSGASHGASFSPHPAMGLPRGSPSVVSLLCSFFLLLCLRRRGVEPLARVSGPARDQLRLFTRPIFSTACHVVLTTVLSTVLSKSKLRVTSGANRPGQGKGGGGLGNCHTHNSIFAHCYGCCCCWGILGRHSYARETHAIHGYLMFKPNDARQQNSTATNRAHQNPRGGYESK